MLIMLAVFACLAVIFVLLVIAELLGNYHLLKGEYHRKFLHISAGSFIAFWPWLISWDAIQVVGVLMLLFIVANRYISLFNYHGWIGRATYGDIFFALAILICSLITHNKVFFAMAILEIALADGLAAVLGIAYGEHWKYKVFGYKKSVIGTMVFWILSAIIIPTGLLSPYSGLSVHQYYFLIFLLPPLLTILENLAIYGIDNIVIPVALIVILRMVQA